MLPSGRYLVTGFWKFIRAVILFPIRFSLAVYWLIWNLSTRSLYLGGAPIFWGETDQCVFYLKRLGIRQFGVVLYEIQQKVGKIVFRSHTPIHVLELRNNHELVACSHASDHWLCTVLDTNALTKSPQTYYRCPGRFHDHILPRSSGFLSEEVTCSDDDCLTQFCVTTSDGVRVIGPRHPNRITGDPHLSINEDMLAFTDLDHIYISHLGTGKQSTLPFGKSRIFNWSNTDILLAVSYTKKCIVLFDGTNNEVRCIEVPKTDRIHSGSISPSGKYIAYWIIDSELDEAQQTVLFLYSVLEGTHTRMVQRAKILDVRWSSSERLLSISGVKQRDLLEIGYQYKMRNTYSRDKEVIRLDGSGTVVADCL